MLPISRRTARESEGDGTKQGGKCSSEREARNAILIGEEKHGAIINTSVFRQAR